MRKELEPGKKSIFKGLSGNSESLKIDGNHDLEFMSIRQTNNSQMSAMLTEPLDHEKFLLAEPQNRTAKKPQSLKNQLRHSLDSMHLKPKYEGDLLKLNQRVILMDEIGQGKFCKVYKCKDLSSQSIRALKVYTDGSKLNN